MKRFFAILWLAASFLAASCAHAQFVTLDLDVQNRHDPFTIDRCYVGNTPLLRFYIYQNGEPFISTNHWAYFKYGTNNASPFMVSMLGETSSSNRVDIVGSTNTFLQANDNWFCELILISKTNNGLVSTWNQGRLIVEASPGAGATTGIAMGATFPWSAYTNFSGVWPIFSLDTNVLAIVGTPTGLYLSVISGAGTLTGWTGTDGLAGGGLSGSVTGRIDYSWLTNFLSTNVSLGSVSNVMAQGGILMATNDGRQFAIILNTSTLVSALSGIFAAQSNTFAGDITGPYSNVQISAGAITNSDVATNASIAAAKIAGTALTQASVHTGDVAGAWNALELQAGVVGSSEITDGGVANVDLGVNVVAGSNIINGTIGNVDLGINIIAGSNILQNTIGSSDMATGAVTTVEILDGTILAADISSGVIPLSVFTNSEGYISSNSASLTFFPTNGGLGGDLYGTPTNALIRTNAIGSAEVTDGTLTTADMSLGGFDDRFVNHAGDTLTNTMTFGTGVSHVAIMAFSTALGGSGNALEVRDARVEIGSSGTESPQLWFINKYFGSTRIGALYLDGSSELIFTNNIGRNIRITTLMSTNGDGGGVTNIGAANIAAGGVFPSGDANALTNLSPQALNAATSFVNKAGAAGQTIQTTITITSNTTVSAPLVMIGDTNLVNADQISNGGFTNFSLWSCDTCAFSTSGLLVVFPPTLTSDLAYTGALTFVAGQQVRVGFDFINYTAADEVRTTIGGHTKTNSGYASGTNRITVTLPTHNTSNLHIAVVAGSTNFAYIDNVTAQVVNATGQTLSVAGDVDAGGNITAAGNLKVEGTISGNATGYLPLATGGSVLGRINMVDVGIEFRDGTSTNVLEGSDTNVTINGGTAWHSLNDGSGSGLDADLLDGKSSTGFVFNLPGETPPAWNAINFTNLPAATSTNSVSGVKVSEATNIYVGTVPLNSSPTIQFSATATGPTASVLSGALTGLPGGGVTGSLNAGILTGSVPLAALANVAQTGQVNQATNIPLAASVLVLATTDGGTTTFYKADDTGTIAFTNTPLAASAMVVASTDGGTSLFLKTEALASSNIVTISSWPIYAAETWTAQYSVVEAFDIFDTATPLTQFSGLIDGGTATVDLINFAPGATTWTTNSTMLLVGVTSIVPSAALSASNHLGIQIRPGATVTNEMRLFVRGWR